VSAAEAREATEEEREHKERVDEARVELDAALHAFDALLPLTHNSRRRAMRWIAAALDNAEVPF
jgi:hypothetical protein